MVETVSRLVPLGSLACPRYPATNTHSHTHISTYSHIHIQPDILRSALVTRYIFRAVPLTYNRTPNIFKAVPLTYDHTPNIFRAVPLRYNRTPNSVEGLHPHPRARLFFDYILLFLPLVSLLCHHKMYSFWNNTIPCSALVTPVRPAFGRL